MVCVRGAYGPKKSADGDAGCHDRGILSRRRSVCHPLVMESQDDAAFRELRQILYWFWDPLNLNASYPFNADEYDRYTRMLLRVLYRGLPDEAIGPFLLEIEKRSFGHGSASARLEATAVMVADWRRLRGIGL